MMGRYEVPSLALLFDQVHCIPNSFLSEFHRVWSVPISITHHQHHHHKTPLHSWVFLGIQTRVSVVFALCEFVQN